MFLLPVSGCGGGSLSNGAGPVRFDGRLRHSGTGSTLSNGAGGEVVILQVRNSRGIVKNRGGSEKNMRASCFRKHF